ncbi:MAG: NAD(P)H-hydrate dehydratase [Candidatus Woesearchaeota archaeon]
MKYILKPDEMRLADSIAMNDFNIPSSILMENAARSASIIIKKLIKDKEIPYNKFLFFCGCGNNGGDGFALARHLFEEFEVMIYWIGREEKMTNETRTNFEILKKLNLPIFHFSDAQELNNIDINHKCIIDAMIGVGGSENIKGIALDILKKIDHSDSFKIAIDTPTGLNTETGIANPNCFKADVTITMSAIKKGMLLNDGLDVCGKIYEANIGAPSSIIKKISKTYVLENDDIKNLISKRNRKTSKFDYGKVYILAGSKKYPGAAALTANSTIKSGAGLVYLLSTSFHSSLLPEIIPIQLPSTDEGTISFTAFDYIINEIKKADVLTIGPGLGDNKETIQLVKKIIYTIKNLPIVIDADGLRFIENDTILRKNIIITPHYGEFSRITNFNIKEIEINSYNYAKELAKKLNCIVLLKGVPSIITDGDITYLNITGNPGMASGGSGDVLTGIISGLLARGLEPIKSASVGAFIHSLAGDSYAEHFSQETLTATSILESLIHVFPKL